MEQPIWNLDDGAFDEPIDGVERPENIQMIQEAHAEVDPQIILPLIEPNNIQMIQEALAEVGPPIVLPLPVVLQERGLDLVMAHARDLQMFREYEGYRFGQVDWDSGSDVPEDDSDSESEDEAQEAVPINRRAY